MTSIYKCDPISCSLVKHSADVWSLRYYRPEHVHGYLSMISGFYEISTCPCLPIDNFRSLLYDISVHVQCYESMMIHAYDYMVQRIIK